MESSVTDTPEMQTPPAGGTNSVQTPSTKSEAEKSPASAEAVSTAAVCPRCSAKLTNPEGLGWCPACGYCRSLEQDAGKAALAAASAARKPSALGFVEFFELLGRLPRWLAILVGGITIVGMVSVAANIILPDDSLVRALWFSVQLGLGLIGLFAAQVWAFVLIAPQSDHLSAKDVILSARLWGMTCRRLPETQRQLWLGGWSMAAMLCAVCIVGGYSYWYQFYKPQKLADRNLIAAVVDAARKKAMDKSLEESLNDFADSQDLTKKKDELNKDKATNEDNRPTVDCVIIGYTVANDTERRKPLVTSLVLATLVDGRLKYAGQVRRGVEPRASDELLKRLASLAQPEPFIPGLKMDAIWVRPQVFCEIHQSGFDVDGHLRDPNFKELLTAQ